MPMVIRAGRWSAMHAGGNGPVPGVIRLWQRTVQRYARRATSASMHLAQPGSPSLSHRSAMNNRQSRLLAAAESAIAFVLGLKNAPSRVIDAAKRLKEAVRAARASEEKQFSAKVARRITRYSITRAKTVLLRKHLGPFAADGLEMYAGLPAIEESLQLPRIKDRPEKHVEAAKRVRRIAEEHAQEFINERSYNDDFLEKFHEAVCDLRLPRASIRALPGRITPGRPRT